MIQLEEAKERLILVGVSEQDGDDTEDSMEELKELVAAAGASVAGMVIQNGKRCIRALMLAREKWKK